MGKNPFHVRAISKSYRNRGYLPRTQINKKAKNNTFNINLKSLSNKNIDLPPKKSKAENNLITRMLAYSAKKIKANPAAPYSILNPETNSDSPSAKSKGARLVSATQVTNHIKETGNIIKANQINSWDSLISMNLKVPTRKRGNSKIKAILTSYEIVWAIARSLPNKAYLEFEDHPASRVP